MQRNLPLVDVEPRTGDEPVPWAILRPHGHLRGVHELEQLLRADRHGRPAGEHPGVDVDDARRRTQFLPLRMGATGRRPRERHGQEARLPGQPRRVARPLGLHGGVPG